MPDVVIAGYGPAGSAAAIAAHDAGRRGEALWDLLDAAVRARGIEVRYRTTAERLVLSPDGSVTGLAARHAGEPVIHEIAGGVILACGGFEADPVLADAYLPLGPSWPVGHPGNTGAGLIMAQQAGAAGSSAAPVRRNWPGRWAWIPRSSRPPWSNTTHPPELAVTRRSAGRRTRSRRWISASCTRSRPGRGSPVPPEARGTTSGPGCSGRTAGPSPGSTRPGRSAWPGGT